MNKYPILISMPATGGTWVQEFIRDSYNKHYRSAMTLSTVDNDDEFFNPRYVDENHTDWDKRFTPTDNRIEKLDGTQEALYRFVEASHKQKIKFLEMARELGIEVCHKILIGYFSESPETLWPWFKEFYKDHNIIILKRKQLWKSYISWMFHTIIKRTLAPIINERPDVATSEKQHLLPRRNRFGYARNEDLLKATIQSYNIKFYNDKRIGKSYLSQVRFLNDVVEIDLPGAEKIWLEDIDENWLQKRFGVEYESKTRPFKNLKYETYFPPSELKQMRDDFNESFEGEFKYYGYRNDNKMTNEWDNYQKSSVGNGAKWRIENLNLKRFAGQDKSLLDLGANQGEFGVELSKDFKHITAVEPFVEAPELSDNVSWVKKSFKEFITESNDTYDVVFSFAITREIRNNDKLNEDQIVKGHYDLVKPDGIVIYETHILEYVNMQKHTDKMLTAFREQFGKEIESGNGRTRGKRMYYIFKK